MKQLESKWVYFRKPTGRSGKMETLVVKGETKRYVCSDGQTGCKKQFS